MSFGRPTRVGLPFLCHMSIENWQRIDSDHSHCKRCSNAFRNVCLTRGYCEKCIPEAQKEQQKIIVRMENKAIGKATKASAKFLSAMRAQGKEGKAMPQIFETFWDGVGGKEGFGRMMSEEFNRMHGIGLSPEEAENWNPSPKMKLQWYELISRHAAKNDESQSLDIGSLEEADLESILTDLAHKAMSSDVDIRRAALLSAIDDDKEFRKEAFRRICKEDQHLVNELLAENGVITIDPERAKLDAQAEDDSPVFENEDDYDPNEG